MRSVRHILRVQIADHVAGCGLRSRGCTAYLCCTPRTQLRVSPIDDEGGFISTFISFHGGLASVLTSDGTLATVAAAMLVMLVRPRLRTRAARPDMAAEMLLAQTSGSTVFCFVGTAGTVMSITPNARQVLGEACDRAADLNLTFSDLVQPDQRSTMEIWLNRSWTSEPPPPLVLATRGPYSERRWLQLQTAGVVDVAGAAAIMIEIREVTEHTEHQNHARMLAHALAAGTDAAWITDLDGRIEY